MFSSSSILIVLIGVFLSLLFICGCLFFVYKIFNNSSQELLVRFILLIFTALASVWVVDKVIAFKINLLSDQQDGQLFDLIKTLILMIFSYYFGTKNTKNNADQQT
ncbi:hypothetical protein UFOVP449_192 [uncultured Caudovirales phage]|uniref:Uncharacterized protein n=1 Tax=uncultured Caudovirales phage TaxID=2100421 RepID=A0A6J5MDM1_9CAUD|nr:hypothetical protein UFOVP449_192 [uncultured Caudovirales phage]